MNQRIEHFMRGLLEGAECALDTEGLSELHAEKGHGLTDALLAQTRVPLRAIRTAPRVFQPRNLREFAHEKAAHIANLADAARSGRMLEPVTVFPIAGVRVVVDGHCRLAAYREAGRTDVDKVAVRHLSGTFDEALMHAPNANSRDKLALTKNEKLESAWNLAKRHHGHGCYSVRKIASATGISPGTVGNMLTALSAGDGEKNLLHRSWLEVKRLHRGESEWTDELEERELREWKEKWAQLGGRRFYKRSQTAIRALLEMSLSANMSETPILPEFSVRG